MGNAPSHPGGSPPNASSDSGLGQYPGAAAKDKEVPAPPASPPPPGTPLLLPFAGHLSPQNPHALSHPQAHDYSKGIVTSLILDNQLAPFYRGLDDWEEDWEEADLRRTLDEVLERDFAEEVQNSNNMHLREEREIVARGRKLPHEAERVERLRRESRAYLGAVECPICFLYYPPNINTSRCCQQPLCTECFVQIKRPEATSTHLESEPACCPFCMETDFGVIYERPTAAPTPSGVLSPIERGASPSQAESASALATSPDAAASGFSVFSVSEDVAIPPKEAVRRKSVSSKAKEVVTIDCIRPDWEDKLNAVKAQAARRANRRIVMRQVGDRLIPIGYTSSRATGQADFSMSLPPEEGGSRRHRRTREREREMEEMMIMEAMRLSLVDHENHQKQMHDEERSNSLGPQRSGSNTPTPSSSRRSSSARDTMGSWRASQAESSGAGGGRAQAAASKLLSKINVNRSRANSKSSVHFAPSPSTLGPESARNGEGSSAVASRARSSSTPSPNPGVELHPSPLSTNVTSRRSLDVSHTALGALDGPTTVPQSSSNLAAVTRDDPDAPGAGAAPAGGLAAAVEVDEPRRSADIPPPAPIPVPSANFDNLEEPQLAEPTLDAPPVATQTAPAPTANNHPQPPTSQNLIDFDAASITSKHAHGQRPSNAALDTGLSGVSDAPSTTSSLGYFEVDRPYAPLAEDD